ncbi:MAG: arsenate reductase (glutaredoxin) [Actinobacteria bacterium]|nr:arsenate reductase (glutaredoxin) [Actinomycetota bacterium]
MSDVTVWLNPRCSKCQGAEQLLAEHGVEAHKIFYLDTPPSRVEIARVVDLLGGDPRSLLRRNEPEADGLEDADRDAVLDALAAHPQLIERPVVLVRDDNGTDRAVVARPPELLLELLAG